MARVVHQDVDAAESGKSLGYCGGDTVRVDDVDGDCQGIFRVAAESLSQSVGLSGCGNHLITAPQRFLRDEQSKASRCAGDEPSVCGLRGRSHASMVFPTGLVIDGLTGSAVTTLVLDRGA